ncbi:glycosyltransferase family 2 protein [Arthrobacter pigmenti]
MDLIVLGVMIVLVLGVSTLLWTTAGLLRFTSERAGRKANAAAAETAQPPCFPQPSEVAVLIAAHNEELVIGATIRSAAALVPLSNIHVISDGSSDTTVKTARDAGVNVLDLAVNKGKAGALQAGIRHFDMHNRFEVVLLLDADTRLTSDYLDTGLPLFSDPEVVAVAGRAKSLAGGTSFLSRLLIGYRERLYAVVQLLFKYGQAARSVNVVSIVPGFASMYRTRILEHIDISAPGLIIEDFNMTFEVHAKQLGRIAFRPTAAVAYTQDPDTLDDYVRQIRRWNLGFWQTVRRHGMHVGKFWAALALHILELVISAAIFVMLLPLLLISLVASLLVELSLGGPGALWVSGLLPVEVLMLGILLPDAVLTIVAALALRRPQLLFFIPVFPFIRIIDAAVCLAALTQAWTAPASSGVWTSPVRRSIEQVTIRPGQPAGNAVLDTTTQ